MDITRRKGVYQEGKVASSSIEGKSTLPFGWQLPVKKNDIDVTTLNFQRFSGRPKLARMFMTAVDGLSSKMKTRTLADYVKGMTPFWDFLDDMASSGRDINEPRQIDSQVVKSYVAWLKGKTEWSIGTKYLYYMNIKTLLHWLRRYHKKDLAAETDFPRNPFPQRGRQGAHRAAYSKHVTAQIEKAVFAEIENIKKKIETPYVKTGKGIDPRGNRGKDGRWKDIDNARWYFENILGCQYRPQTWLMENGHSTFTKNVSFHYKGVDNFWNTMGVWSGSTVQVLHPFALLFAYLSGANLTPVTTMRRDCIKQHPTMNRRFLELQKNRGGNASYKISHSDACVSIVERVLDITKDLALEADDDCKNFLWLYRKQDGKINFLGRSEGKVLFPWHGELVIRHDIRDENGSLVKLNAARMRPTFATKIFLKTRGDILKIKKLLNHEWASTTMSYVSSAGMAEMRETAAKDLANHERKMRAQVAVGDVASELGISKEETANLLSGEYDTYLGKCRDLLNSPLQGEKKDRACTRFNSCLGCPSCVVTASDLHRLLSYYNHINRLRKFMPSDLFGKTYGWIIQAIDEVCCRFKPNTVEEAKEKALSDPYPAWDIKLELAESLEKIQEGNDNQRDGFDVVIAQESA